MTKEEIELDLLVDKYVLIVALFCGQLSQADKEHFYTTMTNSRNVRPEGLERFMTILSDIVNSPDEATNKEISKWMKDGKSKYVPKFELERT